jgi:formate dehydrogenase subunit gamma
MSAAMAWDSASAAEIVAAHRERPGALLPILHALQERFGYVDRAAVPVIAEALGLSRAEVHGVVSFYHDFRQTPVDGDVLALCRAEACQAMGCEDLVAHLGAAHGVRPDAAAPGARLRVESVYCLGNCALAPAALLNGAPVGRLDRGRLDAVLRDGADFAA